MPYLALMFKRLLGATALVAVGFCLTACGGGGGGGSSSSSGSSSSGTNSYALPSAVSTTGQ